MDLSVRLLRITAIVNNTNLGPLTKAEDVIAGERFAQEFAERVCQLIEDKELRVRMGQEAIKSSQRYRADVIMPKWKELFESLCRKE